MKKIKPIYTLMLALGLATVSCIKDLDTDPIDPNKQGASTVFSSELSYKQALAKLYASYAISGQTGGGGGDADIRGIDENFGNYLRQLWGLQELPTDEAIIAWDDATIKNFHGHSWSPNDVFISALYSRIFYSVTICNEYIRNAKDPQFSTYQAEARFLRAFSYFHAIDMFGNVPFVTEADLPGAFFPKRTTRAELFTYIEKELQELETLLAEPKTNQYGRVDRVSAWMLLAKLYLNAKVYTGTEKNNEALVYINKVIGSGYSLDPNYRSVFCADNNLSPEIIFPLCFDGQNTQQYGGMTFILHASIGGGMPLNGVDGGWGGIRTIKSFVKLFGLNASNFTQTNPQDTTAADKRAMFYFNPATWEWDIKNVGTFTQGIGVTKFKNVTATGGKAPNSHETFVSTDFPVFRLADAYLMYAEAVLRGATEGNMTTALGYVNDLITRAHNGNTSYNIGLSSLTLDFICDERGRELYWEAQRRTDLIRFGKFTGGTYLWEWKGNSAAGNATPAYLDLYPIPSRDLMANENLRQNDGYPK